MSLLNNIIKSKDTIEGSTIYVDYKKKNDKDINKNLDNSYQITENIVKEANYIKEEIIAKANEEAKIIQKEAYEKGYSEGIKNGYEDGYERAYDENMIPVIEESKEIRKQAQDVLKSAKEQVNLYLNEQEQNIIKTCIKIAQKIVNGKIEDDEYIRNIVELGLTEYKNKKIVNIKCNSRHIETLKEQIDNIKNNLSTKCDVLLISDDSIEIGNVVIENDEGELVLGIETATKKIESELLGI